VDLTSSELTATVRPWNPLSIDNTYFFTRLTAPDGGGLVFDNHIFRSKWNWQWTREFSLRFIAQYDEVDSAPEATSLPSGKNLNFDVLMTYLVNPGTALFVGYNGNGSELDRIPAASYRERFLGIPELTYDAWQVFVKFSYLLRF
jgi:hypothetical protein